MEHGANAFLNDPSRAWLTEVARTNEKEILVHACLDLHSDGVLD